MSNPENSIIVTQQPLFFPPSCAMATLQAPLTRVKAKTRKRTQQDNSVPTAEVEEDEVEVPIELPAAVPVEQHANEETERNVIQPTLVQLTGVCARV